VINNESYSEFWYYLSVLFLSLSLIEVCVRAIYFFKNKNFFFLLRDPKPKALNFKPHPYCLYVKRENNTGVYPSNSHGFVGSTEIEIKKRVGVLRLYFAGGSTTEEIDELHGPNSHWPALYTRLLTEKFKSKQFECLNAACAGYTSAESLSDFVYRGVDFSPDYLFIYHNINDVWTVQMLKEFSSDYACARLPGKLRMPWLGKTPQIPASFTYQLIRRRLLSNFMHKGLIYSIAQPPWELIDSFDESRLRPFKRNISSLASSALNRGCTPVILKWEHDPTTLFTSSLYLGDPVSYRKVYERFIKENNEILREVAKEYNIDFVDIGPFNTKFFQSDGMHFNRIGRLEFACRLFESTKKYFTNPA